MESLKEICIHKIQINVMNCLYSIEEVEYICQHLHMIGYRFDYSWTCYGKQKKYLFKSKSFKKLYCNIEIKHDFETKCLLGIINIANCFRRLCCMNPIVIDIFDNNYFI